MGPERLIHHKASYVLNAYVTLRIPTAIRNIEKMPATTRTILAFEATDQVQHDHTHRAAGSEEPMHEVGADEAGSPGYEDGCVFEQAFGHHLAGGGGVPRPTPM